MDRPHRRLPTSDPDKIDRQTPSPWTSTNFAQQYRVSASLAPYSEQQSWLSLPSTGALRGSATTVLPPIKSAIHFAT